MKEQFKDKEAGLARIFAFSFEGYIYELARPSLFLVHGGGLDVDAPPPADPNFDRLSRLPGRISRSGLGRQFGAFSMDMRVWVYDKGDFSMRLDVETGTFEHILLSAEVSEDAGGLGRSSGGRSSGARSSGARPSGVMARSSGWMPRWSGDGE